MQGDKSYEGATPSWVIWQLLSRYTRPGDVVLDPMCGSGTTIDVAHDLERKGIGYDLAPSRPDIQQGDARRLPAQNDSADFVFIDPPYSTHIDYSDDPACIGKLDAAPDADDGGKAYYEAMDLVLAQAPGCGTGIWRCTSAIRGVSDAAAGGRGRGLYAHRVRTLRDVVYAVHADRHGVRGASEHEVIARNWHKRPRSRTFCVVSTIYSL